MFVVVCISGQTKKKKIRKVCFQLTVQKFKCVKLLGFCSLKRFVQAGVAYTFPETWSGQVANSYETCSDSGEKAFKLFFLLCFCYFYPQRHFGKVTYQRHAALKICQQNFK